MAILVKGETFGATDTVTSTRLHDLVENATFAAGAVDGVSIGIKPGTGELYIPNSGVKNSQLGDGAVTPAKMNLTLAAGSYNFASATATSHLSTPVTHSHNLPGTLTINIGLGNFQVIDVSADIDDVAALTNASLLAGGHFTFLLKYSGTISGPGTGDWNSAWLFPSTYDGSLTMNDGTFDLISGVIFNDGGTYKYAVSSILNLTNP
jgi:hypothetical protein